MLFGLVTLVAISVATGLVLLVVASVLFATGTIRAVPSTQGRADVSLLEAFAIYLALMCISIAWNVLHLPGERVVGLSLMLGAFGLAMAWPFIRRPAGIPAHQVRLWLGLHVGKGVVTEMFLGIVGYVTLLPLMAVGILITLGLTKISGADASHPIAEQIAGPRWQFILLILLAVVFAPVTEEIMFRGAMFGHLRSRIHWFFAAVVVALIFAAIHPQGWAGIPALAAVGLNLALLRQWRGSIIAPITAHALNNGTLILLMGMMLR